MAQHESPLEIKMLPIASLVAVTQNRSSFDLYTANFTHVPNGYRQILLYLPPLAIPSSNNGQDSVPIKYLAMITIVKKTMQEMEKPEV